MIEASKVAKFLGRDGDAQVLSLAQEHLRVVTTFVRAYTRGNGFHIDGEPTLDLEDVIITATARYLVNPQQNVREQLGSQSVTYASLNGFTIPEQAVLHLYRRRTA